MMLAVVMLLPGCSNDPASEEGDPDEIRFNADVWRVMEGTRAVTYDYPDGLQTEGSFTCAVYQANTTTAYIAPTTVTWDGSQWEFSDGKHYWPATGSLDFFAYMPATPPGYVSDLTCTASHNVSFTCTDLPVANQAADLKEFVYAVTPGQSKAGQGASGVKLTFKHPFARIKLQWAGAPYDHSGITINSVKLKGVRQSGAYDDANSTAPWTLTGTAADFTVNSLAENGDAVPYLVIPQAWAGAIEVNAIWTDWGEQMPHVVTATSATTWEPGYSYTYTFTITEKDLLVNVDKFTEQW